MAKPDYVLITCEHGGNRIPARYRPLFAGFDALLQTHRGYDPGALALARQMAKALTAPLFVSSTSRLLIDLNRSIGHSHLYSEATRGVPAKVRRDILEKYYLTYRNQVEAHIADAIAHGSRVIHLSSHSFTPELDGAIRNADVGLLYDPARSGELELCRRWQTRLKARAPELDVRRNYPYTGKSDGFTAYLRRRFPADVYVGIELEINQKHVYKGGRQWHALRSQVIGSLCQAITAG
ncbi:N-formylglutamate amidohydrolase [Thiobacillus denitrificans]|uniref:N-formylglutamate amidohydrolase n=1 Tax=Thiobacillus denitrificans TaxID=36861 RepID=A0A106BJN8_THIDE|nr:N-formylglutamate amidohydrolase [Thiobacillus denitrificans]KVW93743.1 N-formylglutamate amidohydrolase [Thiobacillus denitrificans]